VLLDGQHTGDQTPSRATRSDARRNAERVLRSAEELFATEGLAVPIDAIAARAGVGVGTVYRHFPTKEALFRAVVVARLRALVERAHELARADNPAEAMFTFVAEVACTAAEKKDLTDELARAGINPEELHSEVKAELENAFQVLLRRAQESGAVRADVTAAEVTALIMGTCMAAEMRGEPAAVPRLVGFVCDGLRSAPGTALP